MINLKDLFWMTIQKPEEAAHLLLSYRFPTSVSWMALALACVLNALVLFASMMFMQQDPGALFLMQVISPITFAIAYFVAAVIGAAVFAWAGRTFGGRGAFEDVLTFVAWLQFLRLAFTVLLLLLMFVAPAFATLLNIVVWFYGLWIVINFQNVTQGFDSLGKSALSLFLSFLGIFAAFTLLVSILGAGVNGV